MSAQARTIAAFCAGLLLFASLALAPGIALAQQHERITDFHSDIVVGADGVIEVTETIEVFAAGQDIKRGILRDFPTDYTGRLGQKVQVGFEVVSVRRDGRAEPFATERLQNGVRIRIGDRDVFLETGHHVYVLTYRTDRQLGFFDDYDEIYWNVTGNDWDFPIEHASAAVFLPGGADVLNWVAYTGRMGEQGQDFTGGSGRRTDASVEIQTTRVLVPGEGFTIAVAFPKGFVAQPTTMESAELFLSDNGSLTAASSAWRSWSRIFSSSG